MAGAIFLLLDGIKGESTDEAHKEEIDVLGYDWGVSNPTTVTVGGGTSAGKVSVQDVNISKFMDAASPTLMERCCSGEIIKNGTLSVQRAGGDKVQALVFELEKILVSSYQTSGSAGSGELPTEMVTLSASKITYKYTSQDKEGKAGAEVTAGWDVEQNIKV